jgi:hypothetical protein
VIGTRQAGSGTRLHAGPTACDARSEAECAEEAGLGRQQLTIESVAAGNEEQATTVTKPEKKATELAEMIRTLLNKPDLRVAVFPMMRGWRAKVYPEPGQDAARLQALVDEKSEILSEQYELVQ